MPRDGSDVYNVPSGTYGVEDTTIESARYNAFVNDVAQDLNYPRPILAGGTGKQNAREALLNLLGELSKQVISNYDFDPFEAGSFYSATTATAAPVSGHAFAGQVYGVDSNNLIIEARDQSDSNSPGRVYVREKKAGTWGAWVPIGLTVIGSSLGIGGALADMFFGLKGTSPNSQFVVNSKADLTGTDLLAVSKATSQVTGQGMCPPGALMDFATPTAPAGWLVCDGQSLLVSAQPALFTAIGYTWGGSGPNFNVPPLMDYFRRHRGTLSGAVGTRKNPANLAHAHGGAYTTGGASADHTHTQQGTFTSGAMSANQSHAHTMSASTPAYTMAFSGGQDWQIVTGGHALTDMHIMQTDTKDLAHTHNVTISGSTTGRSADHTHNVTINSDGDTNEARPFSAAVLTCIKT